MNLLQLPKWFVDSEMLSISVHMTLLGKVEIGMILK